MAILAVAGCAKFEVPNPDKKGSVDAPKIVATVEDDYTISASVTAAEGTGFYAYVVIKGAAKELDAEKILKLAYKSEAVVVAKKPVQACVNVKDSTKSNISLTKLTPNTDYTIYAVASSKEQSGVYSKVVSITKKTTDNLVPTPLYDKCSAAGPTTISIPFNDPITLTDTVKVTAYYFAANNVTPTSGINLLYPVASIPVPKDSVSIDEETGELKIAAPVTVPGAFVQYEISAGSVINALGTPNEDTDVYYLFYYSATTIAPFGGINPSTGQPVVASACLIQIPNEEFELYPSYVEGGKLVHMPEDTVIAFNDAGKLAMYFLADSINYELGNKLYKAASCTVQTTNLDERSVTYPTSLAGVGKDADGFAFAAICLSEEPDFGDRVGVIIPAGAIQDMWGNKCEELSTIWMDEEEEEMFYGNYIYSYGYSPEDVYGVYSFTGMSQYGASVSEEMIIAPSDDPKYDVVIYDMFKNNAMITSDPYIDAYQDLETPLYGTFNTDNGIIEIDYNAVYAAMSSAYKFGASAIFVFGNNPGENIFLQMPSVGTITNLSGIMTYVNGWGFFDRIYAGDASIVKTGDLPVGISSRKAKSETPAFVPGDKGRTK